jgi:hypothetical protein
MRFYDIIIFLVLVNVSVMIVSATNIFPNMQSIGNPINVSDIARQAQAFNAAPGGNELTSFFAFVYGALAVITTIINLFANALFGFPYFIYWAFNCGSAGCSLGYINLFADAVFWMVCILYGIALAQILSSRYIESR